MIKLSVQSIKEASEDALICINPGERAFVIERQSDGGVDDPKIEDGSIFFPVSMAIGTNFLEGGDWTTIPYVRRNGQEVVSGENYQGFGIEWIA